MAVKTLASKPPDSNTYIYIFETRDGVEIWGEMDSKKKCFGIINHDGFHKYGKAMGIGIKTIMMGIF